MKVIFDFDYSIEVVDKKLYDKLEAKHEADCRLISEYDMEIKKLENEISVLNKHIAAFSLACDLYKKENENLKFDVEKAKSWEKRYNELEYVYEKKDAENNRRADEIDKYRRHIAELKNENFNLKNAENERDHYKGLYSSKCDDYDNLLAKQIKTEKDFTFYRNAYNECVGELEVTNERQHDFKEENIKLTEERDKYKELFHSLNHKHQKVVGEMKHWKERAIEAEKNEDYLKRKLERPDKLRTAFERENNALRATLEAVTKAHDKINYEYNLAQENLKLTKEKYDDACKMNKMREDVFESNLKLKKTIEAKDREIDLLRAELDKYKTDDECDDRWID